MLKTVAEDPAYLDNPIIEKYTAEVEIMASAAAAGHNLGWESPDHKPNVKAGAIVGSGVLAEMVQRIILNDEDTNQVIGDTTKAIEDIMKA